MAYENLSYQERYNELTKGDKAFYYPSKNVVCYDMVDCWCADKTISIIGDANNYKTYIDWVNKFQEAYISIRRKARTRILDGEPMESVLEWPVQ